MERLVFSFENEAEYREKVPQSKKYVAFIEDVDEVNYGPYKESSPKPVTPSTGPYNLFDILWSDGLVTDYVRPVSDGATPIGMCVIPTDFIADGEKARFVSLKYMSSETPKAGSLTPEGLFTGTWGEEDPEVLPDELVYKCVCKNEDPDDLGGDCWWARYFWYQRDSDDVSNIKDLRIKENWREVYEYSQENPNQYGLGDVKGKENTILTNIPENNRYPDMKDMVVQYCPEGTEAGDWYIPAFGELVLFMFRLFSWDNNENINDKIVQIANYYPNDCVFRFTLGEDKCYWSSTPERGLFNFEAEFKDYALVVGTNERNAPYYVVGFLQK